MCKLHSIRSNHPSAWLGPCSLSIHYRCNRPVNVARNQLQTSELLVPVYPMQHRRSCHPSLSLRIDWMAHQSPEEAQDKRAAEWNLNLATALFLRLEKRGQSAHKESPESLGSATDTGKKGAFEFRNSKADPSLKDQ